MRFVDLYAGLGGFHIALRRLGHECVFACEIDQEIQELYEKNFGIRPYGDIRNVNINSIPSHDILCAGFPCQPFSKAGGQDGRKCKKWGDLFDYVLEILQKYHPQYIILENVPNLLHHDGGNTWWEMRSELESIGYFVDEERFSPHHFGIPQIRDRVYIVGSLSGLNSFKWPRINRKCKTSILSILEKHPIDAKPLPKQVLQCLNAWQKFIKRFPPDIDLPSFPIWSMEFGADYPYENETPNSIGLRRLCRYRGSHGVSLRELPPSRRLLGLPSYARTEESMFPAWKIDFIRKNRELYRRHKSWIDGWLPLILQFPPSLQKFEWNCKGEIRDLWQHVIQFRASGVRVKRPTTAPSLIAMTTTQVPIIAWENRYMTARECANLQSLGELQYLPKTSTGAFKALGNAVNAEIVYRIAAPLLMQNLEKYRKHKNVQRKGEAQENARPV